MPRGTSLGYPARTSRPGLIIGPDPGGDDDAAAVIAFGFVAASVVEDDDVVAVSLFAVAFGGGVAFVSGDPEVKFEAGLSEELPDERSLGGGELLFGSLPASTVTLISAELDLLLVASLTTCLLLLLTTWPPLAATEEESLRPFPAGKMPPLAAGRTWPVSAPIRLHVLASIASGLDLESSWKRETDDVP